MLYSALHKYGAILPSKIYLLHLDNVLKILFRSFTLGKKHLQKKSSKYIVAVCKQLIACFRQLQTTTGLFSLRLSFSVLFFIIGNKSLFVTT